MDTDRFVSRNPKSMRATFPFQPAAVLLSDQRRVELRVYTGEVLGAESSSVTHVAGTAVNGQGSVSSETISTGQLWLRAENGAKKSFIINDGLPFSPSVGHRVSVITGFAAGRVEKEANLAIYGYEYDAAYWLTGEDWERTLKATGLLTQAWSLTVFVYVPLMLTIIGIPVAMGVGAWWGSRRRRLFRELRSKVMETLDAFALRSSAT